jgi:hypothetical protein
MGKREVQKETRDAVCESISKVLGVDILDKRRKRELINGRMIYYALLRDMDYSWTSIARSVHKNHATIINAYRAFEDLVSYDRELQSDYDMVKANFYERNNEHPFQYVSRMRLLDDAIDLEKQNKKLTLQVNELMLNKEQNEKYLPVLNVLHAHSGVLDDEAMAEVGRKLNHILNGLYSKRHR